LVDGALAGAQLLGWAAAAAAGGSRSRVGRRRIGDVGSVSRVGRRRIGDVGLDRHRGRDHSGGRAIMSSPAECLSLWERRRHRVVRPQRGGQSGSSPLGQGVGVRPPLSSGCIREGRAEPHGRGRCRRSQRGVWRRRGGLRMSLHRGGWLRRGPGDHDRLVWGHVTPVPVALWLGRRLPVRRLEQRDGRPPQDEDEHVPLPREQMALRRDGGRPGGIEGAEYCYRDVAVVDPGDAQLAESDGRAPCRRVPRGTRQRRGGRKLFPRAGPTAAGRAASRPGSCGGTGW